MEKAKKIIASCHIAASLMQCHEQKRLVSKADRKIELWCLICCLWFMQKQ